MIGNIDTQADWDATELVLLTGTAITPGMDSVAFLAGAKLGFTVGVKSGQTLCEETAKEFGDMPGVACRVIAKRLGKLIG